MASYYMQHVNEWLDVELVGRMPDGRRPRVRLRQLSPIEWEATKVGFPFEGITSEGPKLTDRELREYMRDVVSRALVALEVPNGDGERRWQPVKMVKGADTDQEWEIPIEVFDRPHKPAHERNLERCWAALVYDLKNGPPFDVVADDNFRPGTDGALVDSGRAKQQKPPRDRHRKARRSGA